MNRKSKFRVWDGKKFITDEYYLSTKTGYLYSNEEDYGGMFSSHEQLFKSEYIEQQFTGLTDRNDEWTPNGNRFNFLEINGNIFENPELLK